MIKKAFIEFDRKENILIEIRRFGSPVILKASIAPVGGYLQDVILSGGGGGGGGYLQDVILSKSILIVNGSKI